MMIIPSKNSVLPLVFLFLLMMFFGQVYAGVTGKLTGRVTDTASREPLIGVNVMLAETRYGAATDGRGQFVLVNVPPGVYTLSISMMGYENKRIANVRIAADYTTTVDVSLAQVVLPGQPVVVTAQRPLLQKDLTSSAASIPAGRIAALPVEATEQLIQLQAGVTVDAGGKIHIRGGRASEIAYLIDGIPVTDGFDRSQAIAVENNSVQELQVISGTFNAEYGQAQSGIVNIITKKGAPHMTGEVSFYHGDWISSHSDLFYHIDDVQPLAEQNLGASLSGPIWGVPGHFFINGKITTSDGWLYGRREWQMPVLRPGEHGYTLANSTSQPGDSSFMAMNDARRRLLHANVALDLAKNLPITWSVFYNQSDERDYDHRFSCLPEGDARGFTTSWQHIVNLNWVLSSRAFLALSYSRFQKHRSSYLYPDVLDARYLFPAVSTEQIYRRDWLEGLEYVTHQSNNEHYDIRNRTDILKLDYTSQAHARHLVKTGLEYKRYQLDYAYFEVINRPDNKIENLFIPYVDAPETPRHDRYRNQPLETAFYLQDKLEYHELVLNTRIRVDYFDSFGFLPAIPDQKSGGRLSAPLKRARPKLYASPRLGLAFPISDQGIIHCSYGHFTQVPDFRSLYWNSEYELRLGALATEVGNPDLKPERTVSWELGLQQALASNTVLYAALYFKDIRNLLGQEIIRLKGGQAYARYINRDYGNVRGITLALEKRPGNLFGLNLDYTYQKARGNASDPFAVFTDNQGTPPRESEKQVLPLDWDQRHTLNATATFAGPGRWGLSFIFQAGSGLPYTPTDPDRSLRIAFENSARKPPTFNIDLLAHYDFYFAGLRTSFFIKVYNVLDSKNELTVFTDTGRASFTHTLNYRLGNRRPDFYSRPRLVLIGFKVNNPKKES